jgi:hypothetical protein
MDCDHQFIAERPSGAHPAGVGGNHRLTASASTIISEV